MEVKGYCTINKSATTGRGENLNKFIGKDVRILDFGHDDSVLVIDAEASEIAMFDKIDVYRKFECSISGDVICPPNTSMIEQMAYTMKVKTRKGGYNNLLRAMVIQASLMKGHFDDRLLFAKQ